MASTNSIAEGVFAFNPKQKKTAKCRKAQHEFDFLKEGDWYESFEEVWGTIQEKIDAEEKKVLSNLMEKVDSFLHSIEFGSDTIPTVIMLTGVNMSDHKKLFSNIDDYLLKESEYSNSYTATLWANECTSVRNMIESMVIQFVTTHDEPDEMQEWEEDSDSEERQNINVKRSNQTLPHLVNWFNNLGADQTEVPLKKKAKIENGVGGSPRLIVILPDFEAHNEKVLQDFILILSGYLSKLPTLILMFGVASMISAVHDSLPSHVISKLSFEFFKTPPSVEFLNSTLDSVFLTSDCCFMLSGKVLKFLQDVFVWYDFSLEGFIRSLKFCVMDHFYNSSVAQYCWPRRDLSDVIHSLEAGKIKELRKVQSFVDWVERRRRQKDNHPMKTEDYPDEIYKLLKSLHESIKIFYIGLHCLQILVNDLPQKPLDPALRTLYIKAMTCRITESQPYKDCIKTLGFASRGSILERLEKISDYLNKHKSDFPTVKKCYKKVKELHSKLKNASVTSSLAAGSPAKSPDKSKYNKREDLIEIIHKMAQKSMTEFEVVRREALDILTMEVFNELLIQLTKLPFHEAYIYNKESVVKEHMVGTLRADLYQALNNPHEHLKCDCCKLKDQTQIVRNMPDICIVYKLHLRWGSLINIYDWMQSFKAVLEPESDDDVIAPEIQARFTQAVAALQFLGYIKYSNAKKDHVARLTVDS